MTVSPAYWLSNTLLAYQTLLCDCAAFRTLMQASDAAGAAERCFWQDERIEQLAAPFCLLQFHVGTHGETEAQRVTQHVDELVAYLVWPVDVLGAASQRDLAILACNAAGELLDQIAGLVGTGTTYPVRCTREIEPPSRLPDDHPHAGCWDMAITFRHTI